MTPRELAEAYLDRFCAGDVDGLAALLTDDFSFTGPFFHCDEAAVYLEALRRSPAVDSAVEVLHAFEEGDRICLIYRFSKPGVSTLMSQLFEVRDGQVASSLLIFDPTALE